MFARILSCYHRTCAPEDGLVSPYGGALIQAFVPAAERLAARARLQQLPAIPISTDELHDLEMLGSGVYSPLAGFMARAAYESVLQDGTLPNGLPWGLPVTLTVSAAVAHTLTPGDEVALMFGAEPVGFLHVEEMYAWDPQVEAEAIFGQNPEAPAITARRARGGAYLVGGAVSLLASRGASWLHARHQWPLEMRNAFARHGWRHAGAIHVRHPWQRVHEYLLRCVLESSDALLLHGAIEEEGAEPLPRAFAQASRLLLDNYFPSAHLFENPMPARLFDPTPRAILQHAILSQNYGCASLFLPATAALRAASATLLVRAAQRGLTLRPVFLAHAFHCEGCGGVVTEKSCPHDDTRRIVISEPDLHRRLLDGESLPPTVARPDVARLLSRGLSEAVSARAPAPERQHLFPHATEVSRELRETLAGHRACVLWMTGLSGSGKSTIAHRLEHDLLLAGHWVFVLDGDTLRDGLNSDLDFSDEARRENLRRAAEVAKVMRDAGLIVIASFISPFRAERQRVREIIGRDFYEVHVEASLEVCESRDPKGLYRRARAGQIPRFTGISSPYEPPARPDIRLDTATLPPETCVLQLRTLLARAGILRAGTRATSHPAPAMAAGIPIPLQ